MFCQRLSDPSILPLVRADHQYECAAGGIVGMEKVRYESEEAQAAGDDDELILFSKLFEELLLVFL